MLLNFALRLVPHLPLPLPHRSKRGCSPSFLVDLRTCACVCVCACVRACACVRGVGGVVTRGCGDGIRRRETRTTDEAEIGKNKIKKKSAMSYNTSE